jgi:hypothetical protein
MKCPCCLNQLNVEPENYATCVRNHKWKIRYIENAVSDREIELVGGQDAGCPLGTKHLVPNKEMFGDDEDSG